MLVEDGDRVALECQLVGDRQAGRAAADDGDLLAGQLGGLVELQVVLDRVLAEEVLDRVDADVVLDLVAVAAGLAGCRADAAHDGGQRVGLGQAAPGIFLPGHDRLAIGADRGLFDATDDVQVAADVFAGRAGTLAGRRGLDVGRTLVCPARLKNIVLPTRDLGVTFLVTAERQFGVLGFGRD